MEDAYIIKGGKQLRGDVTLSGAKNVSYKALIAALLFDQIVILENIPRIIDVYEALNLIRSLGAKADFIDKNTVSIDGRSLSHNRVDLLFASKIRASFMLFAPLLHRFKECYIPNPGGCRIGARSIDRVVEGMEHLGVKVQYNSANGYYFAQMKELPKGEYTFAKATHTGTELLILVAVIGKSRVVIHNAALEPEIDALIDFLNESGAKIRRKNTDIIVDGVDKLSRTTPFRINSDRNEAVTYATLGLATHGEVTLQQAVVNDLQTLITAVKKTGSEAKIISPSTIHFKYTGTLKPVSIETNPHPGFMTDWQPNWTVLMTQASGESIIQERMFENRFSYVEELHKLGAKIDFVKVPISNPIEYFYFNFDPNKKYNHAIKIIGPQQLHGGVVHIADLRAGASLAVAALVATGESVVHGASIVERGYEAFVEKISHLGGDIKKV